MCQSARKTTDSLIPCLWHWQLEAESPFLFRVPLPAVTRMGWGYQSSSLPTVTWSIGGLMKSGVSRRNVACKLQIYFQYLIQFWILYNISTEWIIYINIPKGGTYGTLTWFLVHTSWCDFRVSDWLKDHRWPWLNKGLGPLIIDLIGRCFHLPN